MIRALRVLAVEEEVDETVSALDFRPRGNSESKQSEIGSRNRKPSQEREKDA
jgi:hypothetical protein